uniref:C2H2-type domain-containing protein n=1 Tax=Phlebotomus papatasi TaxID=29031 RepID=A0A1B0D3U0_PHLPP
INPNDGLPTVACSLCVWNLNAAFKFVSECKISQEWFKKTLEENDTKDFVALACVSSMPSSSVLESCKNEESKQDVSEILSQVTVKIETIDSCPDAASSPHSVNSVKFEDDQDVGNPLETTPEIIEENPKSPRRKRAKKGEGKHAKEDGKIVRKRRRKPRDVKPRIGLICEACGKVFKNKGSLQTHVYVHTKSKPFKCSACDRQFCVETNLREHMDIVHMGIKKYICEACGRNFMSAQNLKSHRMLHSGEKPYQCSICPRRFVSRSNCKTHELNHAKIRFRCDICDKTYASKNVLTAHRQIHSGIRRFQCDVCEKKFLTKAGLNDHSRTHTGEQPWNCPYCSRTFAQRNSMRSHIKTHPEAQTFPCTICKKKYLREDILEAHLKTHEEMK